MVTQKLQFNSRFPFDHRTIPEYFIQNSIIAIGCAAYVLIMTTGVTFFINCSLLIRAGYFQIEWIFMEIDKSTTQNNKNNLKLFKFRLVNAIKFHDKLME